MVLADTAESHIVISRQMLEHADRFLQEGDLIQASEKGWGAVAQYLKATANLRGWTYKSHRDLFTIKDRLAQETDDLERIRELFLAVHSLHQNIYEPFYSEYDVRMCVIAAKEFIDMLEQEEGLDRAIGNMVTTQEHTTLTQRMLVHADEFLLTGDLVQASEKGWGAVAHYLKAVAKRRGWRNESHRDFFTIESRLARETDNPDRLHSLFSSARSLHQNFYEPLYPIDNVRACITDAKEFIDILERAGALDR